MTQQTLQQAHSGLCWWYTNTTIIYSVGLYHQHYFSFFAVLMCEQKLYRSYI